uniref:Uncharacterized protein n=1 Tax=Siphoviridae sp. ctJhT5 TaxID=2826242 RepID=A0A8S5QYC5_9CAUD|nr:MAG TPA: hypothetical protein [Siphoviridae sp. ctJhT5]
MVSSRRLYLSGLLRISSSLFSSHHPSLHNWRGYRN